MLCRTCQTAKPLAFYPYQLSECKECCKARVRANRAKNVEHYRAFDRERGKTPKRKAVYAAKQRRKRAEMGPAYEAAHNKVSRSVSSGAMTRPATCERCPATESIGAHHDDHSKPLDVMWLCPICHAARHKELGRLSGTKKAP